MRRIFLTAVAISAAVAMVLPGTASAAGACALSGKAFLSPGLTNTAKPTTYTFTGTLAACQGLGTLKNAAVSASGGGTASCTANTTSGTATLKWNTGQTSTLSFTTKGTGVYIKVAGLITSGVQAGKKVQAHLIFYTNTPLKCLAAPGLAVASFAGLSTLGV